MTQDAGEAGTPSAGDPMRVEQRALWIGAWSGLGLGGLGFAFAFLTGSEAILLDGIFSVVGFGVALATIRVSQLLHRPPDQRFQFGFAAFEPLVNLGKGLILGFVGLYAGLGALTTLLAGGSSVAAGLAAVYAAVAAVGCFAVAALLRRAAKKTDSPLLAVDVRTWIIDGALSSGVGLSFLATWLIQGGAWAWVVPYVDPALVLVLSLIVLPVPVATVREGFHQLMGGAPERDLQQRVRALLAEEFAYLEDVQPRLRMLKLGRLVHVQLYLIVPSGIEIKSVTLLDQVRNRIFQALSAEFPHLSLDVVFTGEGAWPLRSVGVGDDEPLGAAEGVSPE